MKTPLQFPMDRQLKMSRWLIVMLLLLGMEHQPVSAQPAVSPSRTPRPATRIPAPGPATGPRAVLGNPPGFGKTSRTDIMVELITGEEGVGFAAQRWHQVFERLQIALTIRRGDSGEEPDTIQETGTGFGGKGRRVRVRGRLERNGSLVFSDRTFTEAQAGQLAKWLRGIEEFGAQGSPKGQPVWGLSKSQFSSLFTALSEPVAKATANKSLAEAISAVDISPQYPLSYSAEAVRLVPPAPVAPPAAAADENEPPGQVRQSVTGMAKGTALAVVLSELGLGFRPRRLPEGKVDLQICTLAESEDLWPVGWPQQTTNLKTAPKYFALVKIDLKDLMLDEVLSAASDLIEMPVLQDLHALNAKQIDLSKVKVSHPKKQTTWSLALQQLTFQAKADKHLYIDEAGRPFLWITPLGTVRKVRAAGQ